MENRGSKLMALAGASALLVGAAALLDVSAASAAFSPSARPEHVFASRSEAPVRPGEAPVPAESRPTSPMPYAGGALLDSPEPEPEPIVETAAPSALPEAAPRRNEFRALTSFDGSMEMTSGGEPEPERAAARPFPPPPARWNNPIRWIGVHQSNL